MKADQEGRQATGPEANDLRSESPCTLHRRPVSAEVLLQATERALHCALLLVVMTLAADQVESAGTVSHVAAVCCIFCLLPSPHAGCKCVGPAFPCISQYHHLI